MLSAFKQFFSPSPVKQQAYDVYVQVVAQARQPVFYSSWQVEDTVDGRCDIIVLHLVLLLSRMELEKNNPDVEEFSRTLSEAFFADMDRSLREMGSTDTGVSMRIKNMAQAFYGRMKAYKDAIGDETAMAEALKRNVYREKIVPPEIVASFAAYMGRNGNALKQQSLDAIQKGALRFCS